MGLYVADLSALPPCDAQSEAWLVNREPDAWIARAQTLLNFASMGILDIDLERQPA